MYCEIKQDDCRHPSNCRDCRDLIELRLNVDFVCTLCLVEEDVVGPYYQEGACPRCGKYMIALTAVLNEPA